MPEWKSLFGGDGDLFLGRRGDLGAEPAELVQAGRKVHRMREAECVADRARQLTSFARYLAGLVGVAKVPQGQPEIATVSYAGIVACIRGPEMGACPVVVIGEGLLMASTGLRK